MREVLVDARCLQDLRFRDRGIGQHASSLLAGASCHAPPGVALRLVAGVDRSMAPLAAHHRALFDAEQALGAASASDAILLQLSPMTHSPHPLAATLAQPGVHAVAVVYDFIPLEYPDRYLASPASRAEYLECLSALGDYQTFVSISEFSSRRLQDLLGVPPRCCHVSGVAVRSSVIRSGAAVEAAGSYCLAVLGDDERKNVQLPVVAHARSRLLAERRVMLKVVGHYSEASRGRIAKLHRDEGGDPDLLEFLEGISDGELALLYHNALVTICPSRAEGFSIPVVEANANGCPVIVSSCEAQTELMPLPDYRFDPDDHQSVTKLLESFLDPEVGQRALARQGHFWTSFETGAVQERFWRAVFGSLAGAPQARQAVEAPFVSREPRPRIAVASPVPPDRSGVADYTVATMAALAKRADVHLYTETQGRIANPAFSTIEPLSAEPYRRRLHDGLISVVGNSHLHKSIFDLMLSYGGACIAHDARMLHFYVALMGEQRTLDVASRELGRPVEWNEVQGWLANQRRMPILFLSEIVEVASPAFVHSPLTASIVQELYGREPKLLPFAIYRRPLAEFEGPQGRQRARRLLGYEDDVKLLIFLGDIIDDKAVTECIWAASMLDSWGVPVRMALAGNGHPDMVRHLRLLIDALGLTGKVHISDGVVDERTYQAYLAAADAGIQFRTYKFGGLSGALLDQIAVGLPTVANAHLAQAMESPSYVARIPDGLSAVLAAEKLAEIFERGGREAHEEERRAFVTAHSVDIYAERLLQGMGLA